MTIFLMSRRYVPYALLDCIIVADHKYRVLASHMVKIGPYLSAMAARVLKTGPRSLWRWPLIGKAPDGCGANMPLILWLWILTLHRYRTKTKRPAIASG
ncbi:hypothetical protein L3X38_044630 [Prunus dulcis]|uniref:Uncharacterized protein n=1 Tax=Prunus dulcis TaxID=3755 RepID=A0AAD4V0C1_PRUDU|nr:hypothetical protein L3X38_044630 [Prunus dulcis]